MKKTTIKIDFFINYNRDTYNIFNLLINDITKIGKNKKSLVYEDSLLMSKVAEKGIRLLEGKINNEHENIRTLLVDDKNHTTNLYINAMNDITLAINNERETKIAHVEKLEEIRILDNTIDNTQKDISDMLDYCEDVIEQANEWLINVYKKQLYNKCELKKLK